MTPAGGPGLSGTALTASGGQAVLDRAQAIEHDDPGAIDETAARILSAALAQFEELGVRRTTMEDIARRAGMSRVTIYRRFAGKDALVEAVILAELRRFFQRLDQAISSCTSADERLTEGFAFALDHVRGHALLRRLLRTEPESLLPHLTVHAAPLLETAGRFLADRLGREVRAGSRPPLDAEVAGEVLVRLVLSFLLTPDSASRLETPDEARRFARRYLAPALDPAGHRA